MPLIDSAAELTVLSCRPEPATEVTTSTGTGTGTGTAAGTDRVLRAVLGALAGEIIHQVGPRPGSEIDSLLVGQVLVIGDDADFAAVVNRLDSRQLLGEVILCYCPLARSPLTDLWSLPVGEAAVRLARFGDPDLVPLLRTSTGQVLVGEASIGPVHGHVTVDGYRLHNGSARGLIVQPDRDGASATIVPRRIGVFRRRPTTRIGAEIEISTAPATLVSDGFEEAEPIREYRYTQHPSPLRLVRGVLD